MAIRVYISGISGNKEVKKRQQRVLMILDSKNIEYEVVDITEPGNEEAKEFMQNNSKSMGATVGDANPRHPLPPQLFNGDNYCGDYDQFDLANEMDEIEQFLKMSGPVEAKFENGDVHSGNDLSVNDQNEENEKKEGSAEKEPKEEDKENEVPEENQTENGETEANPAA